MLPDSSIAVCMSSGKVRSRPIGAGSKLPMTAPIRLRLDQATRTAVSERYEHTRGAVERTNCHIVLLADEGRNAPEIAWLVRRGPHQVRKVLLEFPRFRGQVTVRQRSSGLGLSSQIRL